jgi:hypothetical protein
MWTNFFGAVAGAAATLSGLIFVGVSISLARILSIPRLPDRALQSLMLLGMVLVTSLLYLVPGQPIRLLGVELLCIGLVAWPIVLKLDMGMLRNIDPCSLSLTRLSTSCAGKRIGLVDLLVEFSAARCEMW